MVGIVAAITQRNFCILLDLNGCRRSKQGADIDSHVEDRESRVALVGIFGIVIEVAYHHLEIAFEQSCTKADEQQSCQHHDKGETISSQGYTEQQITCKHNNNTRRHHFAKAKLVGQHTAKEREEVDEHKERTIDGACQSGRQSVVCSQEKGEDGQHGVVAKSFTRVGQSQRK